MENFFRQFAHWVEKTPDELAVVCDGQALTYAQLNRAIDRYAAMLWDRCDGQNHIAAYYGDIGIPCHVAVLAALKAQVGIYWADPHLDDATTAGLSEKIGTALVIAEPGLEDRAAALFTLPVIAAPSGEPPPATVPPFAYPASNPNAAGTIRFTSGSTGLPKATPQIHSSLDARARLKAMAFQPPKPPETRHRYTTFNNLIEADLLFPHILGNQVECFDFRKEGPVALAAWVRERRITSFASFVAMARQLFASSDGVFPDLQEVNVVGEPTYRADFEAFERCTLPGTVFGTRFGAS